MASRQGRSVANGVETDAYMVVRNVEIPVTLDEEVKELALVTGVKKNELFTELLRIGLEHKRRSSKDRVARSST